MQQAVLEIPRRSRPILLPLRWLVALLTLLALAAPALAVDKSKVAEGMAGQAGKAFETGDYPRAADLYLNAYRTDANAAYLYGAARSQHLAGRMEQATELYQQFLATPNADAERQKRARDYLEDIERSKAVALAADAEKAQRDDPKLAASLYLDAYKLAPSRAEWLFRAAVAEQQAGDLAAAQTHFEQYLAKAPPTAGERSQAQARLESIRRKLNPQAVVAPVEVKPEPQPPEPKFAAKPEPTPEIKPQVTPQPEMLQPPIGVTAPALEPVRWPGWALVGTGGALAVTGLALYLGAASDNKKLQADMTATNATGLIVGLTHEEAAKRGDAINTRMGVAAGIAGAGLVAAGVGTWLLLRTPARAAVVLPQPGGAVLVWRF
jgi:tetratricopeptide (TPR) repeat protein